MTPDDAMRVGQKPTQSEVAALVGTVMIRAGVEGPAAEVAATRALGNALVFQVQDHLAQTSTDDDVELFFEVHGRPPAELTSWPLAILEDLYRHGVGATVVTPLAERAVTRAAELVQERSTLAWQS